MATIAGALSPAGGGVDPGRRLQPAPTATAISLLNFSALNSDRRLNIGYLFGDDHFALEKDGKPDTLGKLSAVRRLLPPQHALGAVVGTREHGPVPPTPPGLPYDVNWVQGTLPISSTALRKGVLDRLKLGKSPEPRAFAHMLPEVVAAFLLEPPPAPSRRPSAGVGRERPGSRTSGYRLASGRRKVKVVPSAAVERTSMRPPWRWTISSTM